ncbi:MAG: chorismate mutase [Candidatus Marinimicrobia bacterium]|nr:chorismate mutase [Candidatus Neomarinimicrobiota bacterium]
MNNKKIKSLRACIDTLDKSLIDLLLKRMELAYEIGKEKGKAGIPIQVPEREEEIYQSLEKIHSQFIDPDDLKALFSQIIALGRKAGYQGVEEVNKKRKLSS